jgi:hypothetical protein
MRIDRLMLWVVDNRLCHDTDTKTCPHQPPYWTACATRFKHHFAANDCPAMQWGACSFLRPQRSQIRRSHPQLLSIAWKVRCGVHTPKVDQSPYLMANMAGLFSFSFLKDTHRVCGHGFPLFVRAIAFCIPGTRLTTALGFQRAPLQQLCCVFGQFSLSLNIFTLSIYRCSLQQFQST